MMRVGIMAALLAAASALGACSGANKDVGVDPNLFPSGYRQEIIETMRKSHINPAFVTDAAISEPVLRPSGQQQRYSACVRASSRRAGGGPDESREYIAWFWGGRLNQLVLAEAGQCTGAAYTPWPELKNICGGAKCT